MINKNASKFFNEVKDGNFTYTKPSAYLNDATAVQTVDTITPTSSRFDVLQQVKEFTIGNGESAIHMTSEGIGVGGKSFSVSPLRINLLGSIIVRDETGLDRMIMGRNSIS